jgi:sensor histidine kinase YesM
MKLAIAISNLIENAIHACEKQVDGIKYIEISSKYKNQLLFEITNSCDKKVVLDDDGHPFSLEAGHGIGTRSILSFIEETDSDIRYIAEDNKFTVRMIIG